MWPFSKKEPRPPEPLIANAITKPPTFITYRADPVHNGEHDPQVFGRYPVNVRSEHAPAPVPYTQWYSVGRDPEHTWPHQWLYQFASPRQWLSVAGWPFATVGHTQAGSLVYMPQGKFIPQVGRSNIIQPAQTSLGAQAAVQTPVVIDANHANLYR